MPTLGQYSPGFAFSQTLIIKFLYIFETSTDFSSYEKEQPWRLLNSYDKTTPPPKNEYLHILPFSLLSVPVVSDCSSDWFIERVCFSLKKFPIPLKPLTAPAKLPVDALTIKHD